MICRRKVAEDAAAPAALAAVAQLVERVLGKDEVTGSSPVSSSKNYKLNLRNNGFKKKHRKQKRDQVANYRC